VRASLLQGALEEREGRWKAAVKAYRSVADQDIEFLPEVLEPLRRCYAALDRTDEFVSFLHDVVPRYPGPAPLMMLGELIRQREGSRVAAEFLATRLRQAPSVYGLSGLIALGLEAGPDEVRRNLQVLHDVAQGLANAQAGYS